ncbi:unnamed protein product [Brassica napus]|uniref:(rape) hypothetical protein n=1 Tax=Brassica napus TaxID=3708 RepID=A0A817B7T9_BRANA|nr:unnamed protein product [Brassica napus]
MWAFEKRFNEAKFVHSVLFSVADDMHMNLKDIYKPTEDEFAAYKLAKDKGKPCKLDFHTMLLTGDGIDRYGDQYPECQDCLGDIDIGDRGYIRFAVKPNTVTEFVYFKVLLV